MVRYSAVMLTISKNQMGDIQNSLQWRISKCSLLPQRYTMAIMGSLAMFIAFTVRFPLLIALVQIVHPSKFQISKSRSVCPVVNESSFNDTNQRFTFLGHNKSLNLVFFSFYWGYLPVQLPAGYLADHFGGKNVLGLGVLGVSLLTLITPFLIVIIGKNHDYLIVLRVIQGVFEATIYPALNTLIANWTPRGERTRISSIVFSSALLGGAMNLLIFARIFNETTIYYFLGTCGLLWYIAWQLTCFSNPNVHPCITHEEKRLIRNNLSTQVTNRRKVVPWKSIFTCRPLFALIFTELGFQWVWFTLITQIPKYLKEVLHFSDRESAIFASVPLVTMWLFAVTSGFVCEKLINGKLLSVTCARKTFTAVGALLAVTWMVVGSYFRCNRLAAFSAFMMASSFMGCYYSGIKVNVLELAPNFAGILMAVINYLAVSGGLCAPLLIKALIPENSLHQWENIYWLTFFLVAFTVYIYVIFGSAEEQAWNRQE